MALLCLTQLLFTSALLVNSFEIYHVLQNFIEDRKYKEQKVDFWDNVYGFDMSVMKEIVVKEPLIDSCDPNQLVCKRALVKTVDLYTVGLSERLIKMILFRLNLPT